MVEYNRLIQSRSGEGVQLAACVAVLLTADLNDAVPLHHTKAFEPMSARMWASFMADRALGPATCP